MPAVVRLFDINVAGGKAMVGDPTFIVDGRPIVRIGSPVSPHKPCPLIPKHCHALTMIGKRTYIVGGKPANVVGDIDSCGHPRMTGSTTFIVG